MSWHSPKVGAWQTNLQSQDCICEFGTYICTSANLGAKSPIIIHADDGHDFKFSDVYITS